MIDEMMDAASFGRDRVDPEDLANAGFSIMSFGLAKMQDSAKRDERLKTLPEEAAKAVEAIVRVAKKIGHDPKKH
jgi:hypothetical protein